MDKLLDPVENYLKRGGSITLAVAAFARGDLPPLVKTKKMKKPKKIKKPKAPRLPQEKTMTPSEEEMIRRCSLESRWNFHPDNLVFKSRCPAY